MHIVAVAHVLFGLAADLAFAPRLPLGWDQSGTEMLAQVLDNQGGLCNSIIPNRDDGRLAEGVNFF
jgi:hypothetical protein